MAIKIRKVRIVDNEERKLVTKIIGAFKKDVEIIEKFGIAKWEPQKPKDATRGWGKSTSYFFGFSNGERQGVHSFIKSSALKAGVCLVAEEDIIKKPFYKTPETQQAHYAEILHPEFPEVLIITNFNVMIDRIAKILTEDLSVNILKISAKNKFNDWGNPTPKNQTASKTKVKNEEKRYAYYKTLARPEQSKFRTILLEGYNNACVITGCTTQAALEAAHIIPFSQDGEDTLENGLLLRADLHLLFDKGFMAIHPETSEVHFKETDKNYNKYTHAKIPDNDKLRENLKIHWHKFQTT